MLGCEWNESAPSPRLLPAQFERLKDLRIGGRFFHIRIDTHYAIFYYAVRLDLCGTLVSLPKEKSVDFSRGEALDLFGRGFHANDPQFNGIRINQANGRVDPAGWPACFV